MAKHTQTICRQICEFDHFKGLGLKVLMVTFLFLRQNRTSISHKQDIRFAFMWNHCKVNVLAYEMLMSYSASNTSDH